MEKGARWWEISFRFPTRRRWGAPRRSCSTNCCAWWAHVVEREAEARRVLLRDAGYIIEDNLWRAYGTLRYARSLTFDEAMNYLSGVRLAVGLKLMSRPECIYPQQAPDLFASGAPGICEGRALTESETNLARARYVRKAFGRGSGLGRLNTGTTRM